MNQRKETSRQEYLNRIHRVLEYINNNLAENLALDALSDVSCFSPFHFHRIFHAFIGETPNDYVNRLRLERAANCLSISDSDSITEVALKCGFSSSSAFARAFKNHFGYSATQWRNGGYAEYINSKICKNESKKAQDIFTPENYVYDVNNIRNFEETIMEVEIKLMPKLHVAFIATYEGYNSKIGRAFEKLCRWGFPRGLISRNTKFVGVSLDCPGITPDDKCRYNACITVPENVLPEKEIGITDIPEQKCLVAQFNGKQEELSAFYDELISVHLPACGCLPAEAPAYEIYLNDPNKDPERKFVLQACIPVKPL
jgi:AraC family transcriptional regulator